MKRFLLAALSVAICGCPAFAQQALWGGPQVVSPQINGDNTVTFRFFAPEAGSVQVTGDCIAERPVSMPDGSTVNVRTADMVRNADGVWEYTVPEPLASELYS